MWDLWLNTFWASFYSSPKNELPLHLPHFLRLYLFPVASASVCRLCGSGDSGGSHTLHSTVKFLRTSADFLDFDLFLLLRTVLLAPFCSRIAVVPPPEAHLNWKPLNATPVPVAELKDPNQPGMIRTYDKCTLLPLGSGRGSGIQMGYNLHP